MAQVECVLIGQDECRYCQSSSIPDWYLVAEREVPMLLKHGI